MQSAYKRSKKYVRFCPILRNPLGTSYHIIRVACVFLSTLSSDFSGFAFFFELRHTLSGCLFCLLHRIRYIENLNLRYVIHRVPMDKIVNHFTVASSK